MVVNIYINLCKHKIIFVDFVFRFLEFELVFLLHTVINITVILTMRLFGYYIIPEINKDGGFKIILLILNQLKNMFHYQDVQIQIFSNHRINGFQYQFDR